MVCVIVIIMVNIVKWKIYFNYKLVLLNGLILNVDFFYKIKDRYFNVCFGVYIFGFRWRGRGF